MSSEQQQARLQELRLALVLPQYQMVLAERHGEARRLPRIAIRRQERTAAQLSSALQVKWGVQSILIDLLPGSCRLPSCAVIEVLNLHSEFPSDELVPVSIDGLEGQDFTYSEGHTIRSIMAGETQNRGPFSRVGWIKEAQAWIRDSVVDRPVEFNGRVQQLSASGSFALLRFEMIEGPDYWLKAPNARNTHELETTQTISRLFPQCVPPFIGARPEWNAWITEDCGRPLQNESGSAAFVAAIHCIAELQMASVAHIEVLLACGCFDQRMPSLRKQVPDLIQYLEGAMARQTSTRVAPLNAKRLRELGRHIEAATIAMEALGIPDTLIHNDVNTGNILFDGRRAVFTDWAEACIGCPFLTFRHLQVQALEADETCLWANQLREIYRNCWGSHLSDAQIEKAFVLSPPLAIASYLCGRDPSFASAHRALDSVQSYARSLARHLDRFAQAPEFLEGICSRV